MVYAKPDNLSKFSTFNALMNVNALLYACCESLDKVIPIVFGEEHT